MRRISLLPRILAALLSLSLALPNSVYALRTENSQSAKVKAGLEEALQSGDPEKLLQLAGTTLMPAPVPSIPTPAVNAQKLPRAAVGLEEHSDARIIDGLIGLLETIDPSQVTREGNKYTIQNSFPTDGTWGPYVVYGGQGGSVLTIEFPVIIHPEHSLLLEEGRKTVSLPPTDSRYPRIKNLLASRTAAGAEEHYVSKPGTQGYTVTPRLSSPEKIDLADGAVVLTAGTEEIQSVFNRLLKEREVRQPLLEKQWVPLSVKRVHALGFEASGGFIIADSAQVTDPTQAIISEDGLGNKTVERLLTWIRVGDGASAVVHKARLFNVKKGDLIVLKKSSSLTAEEVRRLLQENGIEGPNGARAVIGDVREVENLPMFAFQLLAGEEGLPAVVVLNIAVRLQDETGNVYTLILMA